MSKLCVKNAAIQQCIHTSPAKEKQHEGKYCLYESSGLNVDIFITVQYAQCTNTKITQNICMLTTILCIFKLVY